MTTIPSKIETNEIFLSRKIWPDILRILATFAVIVLHAAANGFYGRFEPNTSEFQCCNIYNALVRFSVPLFVMLSGMFLLNPKNEYPLRKIYLKKILRLAIAFLFWSVFYACIETFHRRNIPEYKTFIYLVLYGHYHMWFLFMISGLYMATPILRQICKDEKVLSYFIFLGFIFVFICKPIAKLPKLGDTIYYLLFKRFDMQLVSGYTTYFLLGHWLAMHKISKGRRLCIYVIGIASALITIIFNAAYSVYQKKVGEYVFSNLWANTFFVALAVFVFCQYFFENINFNIRQQKVIFKTAKLSFGIYLIHIFFLEHLRFIGLPDFFIHPLFSIPITSVLTFVLSFCTIYLFSKIPILSKFII